MVAISAARREALMGTKNTRGGSNKTAPAKSLKEKRRDKKAKRSASQSKANQSVERAFDR
jgi:hypothetical protein